MDVVIFGMGLPSLYIASRLAAEGKSVGLFGKKTDMVPEPVNELTIDEFSLRDFELNKLSYLAFFNEDFELEEKKISGAVIDVERLYRHYLEKAMEYGCEILAGSNFSIEDNRVFWGGRQADVSADFSILEEAEGKPIDAVLVGRIPFNEDTVEFYESPNIWVVPSGRLAVVGGELDFSWHKFERVAILETKSLSFTKPPGRLVDEFIRIGRAAGQVTREGFVLEASLYNARLLVDTILSGDAISIYEKATRRDSSPLGRWLEAR